MIYDAVYKCNQIDYIKIWLQGSLFGLKLAVNSLRKEGGKSSDFLGQCPGASEASPGLQFTSRNAPDTIHFTKKTTSDNYQRPRTFDSPGPKKATDP